MSSSKDSVYEPGGTDQTDTTVRPHANPRGEPAEPARSDESGDSAEETHRTGGEPDPDESSEKG